MKKTQVLFVSAMMGAFVAYPGLANDEGNNEPENKPTVASLVGDMPEEMTVEQDEDTLTKDEVSNLVVEEEQQTSLEGEQQIVTDTPPEEAPTEETGNISPEVASESSDPEEGTQIEDTLTVD